ncbi:MAG TPA: YetF domain-containing protein [Candidatus Angelobacter sp.]|nr:YetF domain-containing protein [Candidatus Angelobacter sp.]
MLTNWHTVLEIAGRTSAIYLLVLVGLRLTGKREVGQMTPFDLTLLLLLSNSVQNAMTGPDTSLLGGVVAAAVLLALNFVFGRVSGKSRRFRKAVEGTPTLLVHQGKAIDSHLAKENISIDELHRALREHGAESVKDVALAVLEVDGSISVLKYEDVPNHAKMNRRVKFLRRH